MPLRDLAMCPPLTCPPDETVAGAVDKMLEQRVGAVLVMEGEEIAGIFTERDVLTEVIGPRRNPEEVKLAEVMKRDVLTFAEDGDFDEALRTMVQRHFRHLPLVDGEGRPIGMLSIRRIFGFHVDNLKSVYRSLVAYIGADGPGG